MRTMQEHPLRYVLANEIHDRPFPDIGDPSHRIQVPALPRNGTAS